MTDVANFTAPPAEHTILHGVQAPADNKFDILVSFLKGVWSSEPAQISFWDPMSLISMLVDGSPVTDVRHSSKAVSHAQARKNCGAA